MEVRGKVYQRVPGRSLSGMGTWDPLVFSPALAMLTMPGPVCFSPKLSSSNWVPQIDFPPVPSPRVKSPYLKGTVTRI